MKLASFSTTDIPKPRLGIVRDDEIVDVDLAARALNIMPYDQALDLLDHYEQGMQELNAILGKAANRRFSEVRTFTEIGAVHSLSDVQLAAPIPRPRKNIICLGQNYAEHAKESAEARGHEAAELEAPIFFTKAPTTVNSPYGKIVIDPSVSVEIDWEAELAVIIRKGGKNIREEEAFSHVFGYTVLNDVSAPDLQWPPNQNLKAKRTHGYFPHGPWLATSHYIH